MPIIRVDMLKGRTKKKKQGGRRTKKKKEKKREDVFSNHLCHPKTKVLSSGIIYRFY